MCKKDEPICVLLADDYPVTRAGICAILKQAHDIQVVGEAQDGFEAQRMAAKLKPHVLLLDWQMPGPWPSDIVHWVHTHCPETSTLVLTAHDRDAYLAEMMQSGACGYLLKNIAPDQLAAAIRCAARGEVIFDEAQQARAERWCVKVNERWASLSRRERQVACLLMQGLDNAAIAEALHVTSKTAAYHVANILEKLKVASRQEVIAWVHANLPDDIIEQV